MSVHKECFDIGVSGRCGPDCDVLIRGECEDQEEIVRELMEATAETCQFPPRACDSFCSVFAKQLCPLQELLEDRWEVEYKTSKIET